MPLFRLTPVPARLLDPLWQSSQAPHELCYVAAANEQKARAAATKHFRMGLETPLSSEPSESPWQSSELTTCSEAAEVMRDIPTGFVYRPGDVLTALHRA
jgi:hypothetical protein